MEPPEIWSAVMRNDKDAVMHHLLELKADVNTRDELYRRSLLHLAASRGFYDMALLLLEHGADVNAVDHKNNTPLHIASLSNHHPIVTLLLAHSECNPLQRDSFGLTPFDWISQRFRMLKENIQRRRLQFADDEERERLLVRIQTEMGSMIEEIANKMRACDLGDTVQGGGEQVSFDSLTAQQRADTEKQLRVVQEKISSMRCWDDLDDITDALDRLSIK